MEDLSRYAEQGTPISGYEELGPYHCGDCIHRLNPKSDLCIHPIVAADPYLKDRLVTISDESDYRQAIKVNLETGCCGYVHTDKKPVMLVLRHGETGLNKEKKFRSLKNVPLDDNGIAEAEAAAAFLKNYPIVKIVTSPLDRAYHTAMMVAEVNQAPILKDRMLLPWDLGELSGKSREEYGPVLQHYIDNPEQTVPGGESLHEFRDTMFAAFDKYIPESSPDSLILFVAHTSTVTTLCQWADDNYTGQPEVDDESVQPGGVAALYKVDDKYEVRPIFGGEKKADYGS